MKFVHLGPITSASILSHEERSAIYIENTKFLELINLPVTCQPARFNWLHVYSRLLEKWFEKNEK